MIDRLGGALRLCATSLGLLVASTGWQTALAQALPSARSRDYGRPFAEVFAEYDHDFYRIDPALFAPAEVWVSNLASGRTWHAGATDLPLLRRDPEDPRL